MTTQPPPDLEPFLARPELQRLWSLVRERLERLGGVRGSILLADAGEEERRVVAGLLGLSRLPPGEIRIPLARLDRALRGSRFGVGLEAAMALWGGPLRDLAGEREDELRRRQELWDLAAAHPAVAARPRLLGWLADLRGSGLLFRLGGALEAGRLLEQALAVLAALAPLATAREELRLPVLASQVLGHSHALDAGRPVATLVLRALAALADRPPPAGARERRELWEEAGVITDELSCALLVLGLAPESGGKIGEGWRAFAAAGEPVRLTLRQLLAGDLAFPPDLTVRVCENPVVVAAAADRWGAAASPLVCLEGFANHAARTLLTRLARQGARFLYHGDFDWAGLSIANKLREMVPFEPWRFSAGDYRRALTLPGERPALRSHPVAAEWDPDLAPAMAEAGVAVEEEAVLGDLLADLAPGGTGRAE